jgi:hypothetical protein
MLLPCWERADSQDHQNKEGERVMSWLDECDKEAEALSVSVRQKFIDFMM